MGSIKKDYLAFTNPEKKVLNERKKIKVKVYSNFIRDIIKDMGFTLVKEKPNFFGLSRLLERGNKP